ncbi:MAG: MASE3 domain-containing protein [Hydrogenophaga sp.]|nr:MASE3 domain-containing protein [Hydrogenophaga sp.]
MTPAPAPTTNRRQHCGLRCQVGLAVLALGLVTLWAMAQPLGDWHIPRVHYLPLHTLMELASVFVAFLVFATVWHTPDREVSGSLVLLALALAASGWLDIFHTLSFRDMPVFITPSSSEKSIAFWLVARAWVALSLLAYSLWPELPPMQKRSRHALLFGACALVLFISWGIIFHEHALPDTFVPGTGLTPLKVGVERAITAVLALAAWLLWRRSGQARQLSLVLLFGATMLLLYGEVFLTRYALSNDLQNMLGHMFKALAYLVIYWGLMVVTVRRPYQALAEQTLALQTANETLRAQALALDSTVTPIGVFDAQGNVLWRNRASHELLPSSSLPDQAPLNLFKPPAITDAAVAQAMRQSADQGSIWSGVVPVIDGTGRRRQVRRVVTPLSGPNGKPQGYISVSEDVTDSLQAQSRYQRVLETALDGFCVLDDQGRLLETNQALATMSGYSMAELVGKPIRELDATTEPGAFRARSERVLATGHDLFDTHHRHKQGHIYPVEVSITRDPHNGHFYAFVRDTSERDRADAARHELERQLQQAQKVQALGQLTGGIAHDFNNILTAVLGYSTLALDRLVPDKQSKLARYLGEVVSASERGRDLIAKLMLFTRTQATADVAVIAPAAVLDEVVAMLKPSIPPGVVLDIRVDDATPLRIHPGELNQVLVNLILNARDAMGAQGHIGIHLHRVTVTEPLLCAASHERFAGPFLALDVTDSGSGIPAAHLPRLFEPFFTTKGVGKGTGLGLPMVQGILRRAGAFVTVLSQPGVGTRFRLCFPLPDAPLTQAEAPRPAPLRAAGAGRLIWVLDDQPAVGRYLRELLSGEGYEVAVFDTPQRLLDAFDSQGQRVAALITDLTMPGMDGLALAERVHRRQPTLPIFLCTGNGEGLDAPELAARGIRQVLRKPLDMHSVLQALADAWPAPH